jgi:hypothetical protein
MKYPDFKNTDVFADLEDKAIDGLLDYDNFPPCEYKYFSRLSKLGYMNRVKGWSVEICEAKQKEYRLQYRCEREKQDFFGNIAKKMQANIRAGEMKMIEVNKAKTRDEKLTAALEALGLITGNENFAKLNF